MTVRKLILLGLLLPGLLAYGPCGPIPGTSLSGELVEDPVRDWKRANDVEYCFVEVGPDSPHSVTVNCMSDAGQLFVSCSECEGKTWSGMALEDPRGRVKVGDQVHPVTLQRVTDPAELDRIWLVRARKVGNEEPGERPDDWWSFELSSR